MSAAIRAAQSKQLNNDKNIVFSLHGDGELDEGQIWEALLFANYLKEDYIISTVDWIHHQMDGPTEKVMNLGNLRQKFEAFGWNTLEMNGNDLDEVIATLTKAKELTSIGTPIVLMIHTVMSKGWVLGKMTIAGRAFLPMMNN